jgi:predicted transcriptional regulator
MAKFLNLSIDDAGRINNAAKALSSPIRLEIIKTLYRYSLNINEIAEKLSIPASSAAMHIRVLEQAELVTTEPQPGTRGNMKLCSIRNDFITIRLRDIDEVLDKIKSVSMPLGAYTDFEVYPTCGLASAAEIIGHEDLVMSFYLPERIHAGILWSAQGFVEYRFPNSLPKDKTITGISLSMEICSEAPHFREDWKSDITIWINDVDCGTWTSPGDFGATRGILNPSWWPSSSSQYGLLNTWSVISSGCFVNEHKISDKTIDSLSIPGKEYIKIRIGNKKNAEYLGGFTIYGREFGNFAQDIVLTIHY